MAATYAVVAFVAIQVADLTFVPLGLPAWTVTLAIVLVALGFPVALVLAWAFELTPEGLRHAADAPKQPRGRWKSVGVKASLVVAAMVGALLAARFFAGGTHDDLLRRRVAVAVFENGTGDAAFDPLGAMAAAWITQGLVELRLATGVIAVVPSSEVIYADRASPDGSSRASRGISVSDLAQKTGAGTVVSGAYFLQSDTLRFQAEVIDASTSEVLRSVSAGTRSIEAPMQAIDDLRDRIQAALATLFDLRISGISAVASQPPTFEACQEYVTVIELLVLDREQQALTHLYRAYAADSSYTLSLLWAGLLHVDREGAGRDSVLGAVTALDPARLRPYDRMLRDVLLSSAGDDPEPVRLQKFERLLEIGATELYAHGHREGALALLERSIAGYRALPQVQDPERVTYLDMLGDPTPEQREMLGIRERYGRTLYLAGRFDEAKDVFRDLHGAPSDEEGTRCWLNLARIAAREGDEATAMRWSACVWDPDVDLIMIDRELEQARLHALLDRKEEAVRLLTIRAARRDPFGSEYMERHRDFDLRDLRGYPPFEELLRPKG